MATGSPRPSGSKARAIEVPLAPDRDGLPLYSQLYRQLREHILSGRLAAGASLPSARVLAADLHLSRNTVEAAISQLRAEGLVSRRVGSGTVVTDLHDAAPFRDRTNDPPAVARDTSRRRTEAKRGVTRASSLLPTPLLSPRGETLREGGSVEIDSDAATGFCTTDMSRFPTATWNRTVARVARKGGAALLHAGELAGDRSLRERISEHVGLTRGLRCTADQVVILNSTQQALDLAGRLLLSPDDDVWVEEPGYRAARATFVACGARVTGVPVDEFGLIPDRLRQHVGPKLLYLTPSHQFPLGVTLTLPRRLAVLAWAQANGCWIIEDDYDSEFRYDGRPVAAMQGLDRGSRVLYVGTFNKVLFPGARVAFMVVPPELVEAFVSARRLVDGGPPTLMQVALAEFMAEGHYAAHLRRSRRFYEAQRNLLVGCLRDRCGEAITIGASETGLHLVAHLAPSIDDVQLAQSSVGHGLGVAPLSRYYAEPTPSGVPRGLLFGFGGAHEKAIRASVDLLARQLRL